MGQFSWLDCIDHSQIVDNRRTDVYVLVPQEFGGGHIKETYYDGYGRFGGHDIYDLVADWNRNFLNQHMLEDVIAKKWGKDDIEWYQKALYRQITSVARIIDFKSGKVSDDAMKEKYGKDYKRVIGIDIACYDEQNAALPYPIKITHNPNAVYEDCEPSLGDPHQGWECYDDDEGWY